MKNLGKIIILFIFISSPLFSQWTTLDWKMHNVGKVLQLVTNMGTLDDFNQKVNYPGLIFCEMPPGSDEEHVYQGGIWIGAITPEGDTLVSVTRTHFTPAEFFPGAEPADTIWVASKGDTIDIPYWPGYNAVSDQDFICKYSDYHILNIENHTPLFLDVIQTSYAWSSPPLDEFIILRYNVIPTKINLSNVYISFWLHGEVGNIRAADNFIDELSLYFPDYQMIVAQDAEGGNDGDTISPIGIKVLAPQDSLFRWSFKHYTHESLGGFGRDPRRYQDMSSGKIMHDRTDPSRAHIAFTFGPFEQINVGDTLHFEIGEIFGYGMDGLLENAEYLEFLRDKEYKVPSPPPKPILTVTTKSHEVYLNWDPTASYNPETYQDPYRGDEEDVPFEGYRVYKSTQSSNGPWTLLAEYDLENEYGDNTGIEHEYTDVGLLDNLEYYYSVSAFSKPDPATNFPSQESSVNANARKVVPGSAPPQTVGEVAVVPNPYRGDIAYHSYNPPWEKTGKGLPWMEQDRRIQFINLPAQCEIKVYTLAGDLIDTIHHDDPTKGYEDWNLTSAIGQAISSGLYLYTVEDNSTGKVQVGKFVVIK